MPANPIWKRKLHGIFVLGDAWDDSDIIDTHLEMVPRIWKVILLANLLLVSYPINVLVELLFQPHSGNRAKASPEVSQNGIEHTYGASRARWRRIIGIRAEAIVDSLVSLGTAQYRAFSIIGKLSTGINLC